MTDKQDPPGTARCRFCDMLIGTNYPEHLELRVCYGCEQAIAEIAEKALDRSAP